MPGSSEAVPVISSEPVPKSVSSVRDTEQEKLMQLWIRDENIMAESSAVCV